MKKAFTLIELLVVVLIIAILAAIALPQYQKAVEKTKVAPLFSILHTIYQAQQVYFMTHGKYATSFDKLDFNISWPHSAPTFYPPGRDTRTNQDWEIGLKSVGTFSGVYVGRLTGPYAGTGFFLPFSADDKRIRVGKISCFYNRGEGIRFAGGNTYCTNIWNTTGQSYPGAWCLYPLP